MANVVYYLSNDDVLTDWGTKYEQSHAAIAPIEEFVITDADFEDLRAMAKESGFKYDRLSENRLKDLRKVAEFDNYRKRTMKEKAELILNGGERTITKILPVIDDMERAIENGKKTEDVETLREGMDLIYKKFMSILKGEGVERIDTEDKDFSTDYHEAIAMVPGMGDDKKGKVIDSIQTGYTLNGKVIRYAKVAVGQ
jgi:molecular chaperone GrpE